MSVLTDGARPRLDHANLVQPVEVVITEPEQPPAGLFIVLPGQSETA
jgi:hypothetical protein